MKTLCRDATWITSVRSWLMYPDTVRSLWGTAGVGAHGFAISARIYPPSVMRLGGTRCPAEAVPTLGAGYVGLRF